MKVPAYCRLCATLVYSFCILQVLRTARTRPGTAPVPRRVIATMYLQEGPDTHQRYASYVSTLARSLRSTGCRVPMVIMYTADVDAGEVARMKRVLSPLEEMRLVTRLSCHHTSEYFKYSGQLTKLHIWELDAGQVMYYDADHVFLRDPTPAFDLCGDAPLCATGDQGLGPHTYFNAGFLVVRPSTRQYQKLLRAPGLFAYSEFCDQGPLNQIFKSNWKPLPKVYNLMHAYHYEALPSDTVSIHEKSSNGFFDPRAFPFCSANASNPAVRLVCLNRSAEPQNAERAPTL
jgi:hypothetical protein